MTKDISRARLVVDIDPDDKEKLERYFKWGDLSAFFRFLVSDLLETMENPEHAKQVMAAYVGRKIGLDMLTPLVPEKGEDDSSI